MIFVMILFFIYTFTKCQKCDILGSGAKKSETKGTNRIQSVSDRLFEHGYRRSASIVNSEVAVVLNGNVTSWRCNSPNESLANRVALWFRCSRRGVSTLKHNDRRHIGSTGG